MITPYPRPQHKIFQNLRNTATSAVNRFGALAIGPQYLLALNDGRDLPEVGFTSAGAELPYSYLASGVTTALTSAHVVKQSSVKLYGRNLEAAVATGLVSLTRDGADNRLRSSSNLAGPSGLNAALGGRSVRVGDLLVINADNVTAGAYVAADTTFYRKVTSLLPKLIPSSAAATAGASTNAAANVTASTSLVAQTSAIAYTTAVTSVPAAGHQILMAAGGRFSGKVGEEITLTCTAVGAAGIATFTVAYTTLGTSQSVVSTAGVGDIFTLALSLLGGTVITLDNGGDVATVGDTVRLVLYPVHAANAAAMFEVDDDSLFTGSASNAYIIEVMTGGDNDGSGNFEVGTSLRIYDANGLEPVQTVAITAADTDLALGTLGLRFSFLSDTAPGSPDLVTGDKFIISVTAASASTTLFDGVVVDGPAMVFSSFSETGKLSVDVREMFTGEITSANAVGGDPLVVTADSVTYDAGIGITAAKTVPVHVPFVSARGTLVVSFKAAVQAGAIEGPIKVTSRAGLSAGQLGELHIENDLAYGAYNMLSGSGETPIHVLRTSSDDEAGYTAALRKIRGIDIHYALCPLSDDFAAQAYSALHVEEMSSPSNMNFRRCYGSTDSPGEYTLWGALGDGSYRTATLIGDTVTIDPSFASTNSFTSATAPTYVGDIIQFLSLSEPLVVTEVISADAVRVSGAPPVGVTTASAFKLIKPDTADNTIDYVIARSLEIDNRRFVNVWCDRPTALVNGVVTVIPSRFLAANIAGLRSILPAQKGLTMTEIDVIDDAPAMVSRFTPEQLDRCASAGVLIVTQEIEGGEIFIRHQLTTKTSEGALQYEDSPGVVVDRFSFQVKDKFRSYIGGKNVTEATIDDIRLALKQLAIDATQELVTGDGIGALIIGFKDKNGVEGEVTVEVDGDLADKIRTQVVLVVALPLNGLAHYIDAEASSLF